MKNKVSVALCVYNGEKYLPQQLESILSQSRLPDEIVLLDDCSQDNSVKVAEEILKKGGVTYKILLNKKNEGVKSSFQKCILACNNEVIFTADQDDVWKKMKIERLLAEFDKDEECVLAFSNAELVDEKLKGIRSNVWDTLNLRRAGLCDHVSQEQYQKIIMYYWVVPGMTMAFRREFANAAFPIPKEGGYLHDSWLAINAPAYGKIAVIDEELVFYRQHSSNTVGMTAEIRSQKQSSIVHMQKVLFYLKKHRDRLKLLLGNSHITDGYRMHIEKYVLLFDEYSYYEDANPFQKAFFLIKRFFDGGLEDFDIHREDIVNYMFNHI